MCSVSTVNAVIEVVEDFIKQEKIFTAYDITTEVRKRAGEQVDYHSEIKRVVHGGFDWIRAGYQSTLITLDIPQNPQAFVYHPLGTDPMKYPLALQDNTDTDDNDNGGTDPVQTNKINRVTGERRLNIPKKILGQVQPNGGSFDISVNGTLVCKNLTALDNRIRLSSRTLGDIKIGDLFKVSADTDKNIILVDSV